MSLNFEKTNLVCGNTLVITTADGKFECIPEDGATDEQKIWFAEYREKYPEGKPEIIDLPALIEAKIKSLSDGCNETITRNLESNVDGTMRSYDFELENQVNMSQMANDLKDAQRSGINLAEVKISYYAKGESCHDYTAMQFLQLEAQGKAFKLANIQQYKDNLKLKAQAATTKAELDAVTWQPLPSMLFIDAYKSALIIASAPANPNTNTTTETPAANTDTTTASGDSSTTTTTDTTSDTTVK